MSLEFLRWLALLAGASILSFLGTRLFCFYAIRRGIVAAPNFRSLHQHLTPRGGGIVFSLIFIFSVSGLWLVTPLDPRVGYALVVGGLFASLTGFIDDVRNLTAGKKILIQGGLAAWILFCVNGVPLVDLPGVPNIVDLGISWFSLVWLMNLFNFMDGIDGMAASGAVLITATSITVLFLTGRTDIVSIFGLLGACSLGFLFLNWPPAKVFMGDAGSLFLGFCLSALIAKTRVDHQISVWTWLVIFGYFAGDTTTTTIVRIFIVKKWYGEHRSHAYQNLARIWGSHLRVLRGGLLYHVLWLLPLAIWSTLHPPTAPLAALLALGPVVVWTLRHGPLLSST